MVAVVVVDADVAVTITISVTWRHLHNLRKVSVSSSRRRVGPHSKVALKFEIQSGTTVTDLSRAAT